jgi:hypothetical protein
VNTLREKKRVALLAAAIAAASALIAVPLTSASSVDTRLEIGQSLHFVGGPGASAGTFVASGAIHDSGTVTSQATITPLGNQDDGRLEGTETFVGESGTFTTEFSGIGGPIGATHEAARGTFRIVDGTGAYAELHGQGTFLIVIDFSTLQAVRTDDGQGS